jgi:hypothetical protein
MRVIRTSFLACSIFCRRSGEKRSRLAPHLQPGGRLRPSDTDRDARQRRLAARWVLRQESVHVLRDWETRARAAGLRFAVTPRR